MSRYQFFFGGSKRLRKSLERIEQNQIIIMATQAELTQKITAITAQLQKVSTESTATLQKVADLQAALENQANVTPELQAAVDALALQVQLVDDLIPDVSNGTGATPV